MIFFIQFVIVIVFRLTVSQVSIRNSISPINTSEGRDLGGPLLQTTAQPMENDEMDHALATSSDKKLLVLTHESVEFDAFLKQNF